MRTHFGGGGGQVVSEIERLLCEDTSPDNNVHYSAVIITISLRTDMTMMSSPRTDLSSEQYLQGEPEMHKHYSLSKLTKASV